MEAAHSELRTELLRVEARWSAFAAFLSHDMGDADARDALTNRAHRLAQDARYADMHAYARSRQSQWAAQKGDARLAIALADEAMRVRGTSAQTRAWCALRAAHGHSLAHDTAACERRLHEAYALVENDAGLHAPPWTGEFRVTRLYARMVAARCWLPLEPRKAIPLYQQALREWPRSQMRDGGLHQARLAIACAAAGERDRAEAEGRKALAIARTTGSSVAAREIQRLRATLAVT